MYIQLSAVLPINSFLQWCFDFSYLVVPEVEHVSQPPD